MNIYLRILNYVKPYKFMVFISLISSFLFVLMNAFSLWMISSLITTIMLPVNSDKMTNIINNGIYFKLETLAQNLIGHGTQIEQLKMLCILLFGSFILKNIFYYINNISLAFVKNRLITDIRDNLFEHLHKLSISFFQKSKTGEISTILLKDVSAMRVAFTETILHLINEPISLLIFISMLFIISGKLALITLLGIPVSALIIVKLGQSIRRKAKRSSKQIAGVTNVLLETLNGIRIVKAFAMEKFETLKFKTENQKYFNLIFKQDKIKFLTAPTNDLIGVAIGVTLLWIGGKEVLISKSLDPEGFIRFIFYLFGMMQPARKLGGVNAKIQAGIASAERVFSIIDTKPDIIDMEDAISITKFNKSIKFKNVSFSYSSIDELILNNINIEIKKGENIALVGKSGAGKSTFVDLILRFHDTTRGNISIDGIDLKHIQMDSLRQQIGYVTQETILFNDSIENNIRYGKPKATLTEVINASKLANAHEFIKEFPNSYETEIGEKGARLSGGQRQRISIARAILKNPEILILDEATSSLDSEAEAQVQKAVDHLIDNRTVIVVAHRLSTIINADKILVFDGGCIIDSGNHGELIKKDGIYKQLFEYQFSK
jgi:ABC-type multidrug transport system fused ATPase/permease subunit